jgi:hypothetical protein
MIDRATYKVHFDISHTSSRQMRVGLAPEPPPGPRRVPRVAKLMALAVRFDGLVRSGQVKDFAEIARLGYVTRGRISQIMDLANLAPDIQEELLFLEPQKSGKDPITERHLRAVTRHSDWASQRRLWRAMTKREAEPPEPAPDGVIAMRSRVAQVL